MSSGEEREESHVDSGIPEGRVLPLNSRRLVAEYVKAIAMNMGLPTRASTDEVRQMVEGKLSENGHEPHNVQVVIQEPEEGTESEHLVHLFLVDEAGVFKEIETEREHVRREATDSSATAAHAPLGAEGPGERTSEPEEREEEELDELQQKTAELEAVTHQLSGAVAKIGHLKRELQHEKERYRQLWRMNCAKLVENDAALAAKDDEIAALQRELSRSRGVSRTTPTITGGDATGTADPAPRPGIGTHFTPGSPAVSHPSGGHGLEDTGNYHREDRRPVTTVPRRQGKAPPIDSFTGEDAEMRFEDWLPSLNRAAQWNQWTPQESLMQLAGHLRGRALQEWGLLEEEARRDWRQATTALRTRLDPGNKVLAATFQLGEWILIRFPQEESGANRKLSRPWHGPYRVINSSDTGVTAVKVYFPDEPCIQVHQSRVSRCPEAFPAGFYWYGNRRAGPGRPPRWIEQLLSNSDGTSEQTTDDSNLQGPRESTHTSPMETDGADTPPHDTRDKESSTSRESAPEGLSEEHSLDIPEEIGSTLSDSSDLLENEGASVTEDPVTVPVQVDSTKSAKKRSESQGKESPTENMSRPATRTRTRKVRPPDRLMLIRARDELTWDPGICSSPVHSQ